MARRTRPTTAAKIVASLDRTAARGRSKRSRARTASVMRLDGMLDQIEREENPRAAATRELEAIGQRLVQLIHGPRPKGRP